MSDDNNNNNTNIDDTRPPPLTVTASSSPTDERRAAVVEQGDWSDGHTSQSRVSDHIEIPENNNQEENETTQKQNAQDGAKKRRKGPELGDRNRRLQGPGLKWHKAYSELKPFSGRVLVIDFAKGDKSNSHIRKVAAQEIFSLDSLRRIYHAPDAQQSAPAMRVIHVQNADWAIPFLLRKYNISSSSSTDGKKDDTVVADFGRYLRYKKPEMRGGKPFLAGKTWKVQYDPWRGVNKTSFGLDYIKSFPSNRARRETGDRRDGRDRMMQLDDFDDNDEPICSHDVYVQRVSCYIQHQQTASNKRLSLDDLPQRKHFYPSDVFGENGDTVVNGARKDRHEFQSRLRSLDNGNAIIIFDNSSSGCIEDTLIPARRDLECRWRRLPFYLAFESRDPIRGDDETLALNCSKAVLADIFKAIVMTWDGFLDHAVTHMTILEDKIYDQPADESRAPELWANSSAWLKVEKLVNVHSAVMHEMQMRLHELTDDIDTEDNWLDDSPGDFERLMNLITEDLTKPTESLISLLYQSVSIRDSRHSLELGVSMWRLSWITFIFLPLTFIVGFFGMNVDTFADNPSMKWYFIAAIPFMVGVIAIYFFTKRLATQNRRTPRERAVYESFFQEMAALNPVLWSRSGPRTHIRPRGRVARVKWALVKWWLRPTNTIVIDPEDSVAQNAEGDANRAGGASAGGDSLGTISRIQRYLSKRWTDQISRTVSSLDSEAGGLMLDDLGSDDRLSGEHSIGEGLTEIAETLSAAALPVVVSGRPASDPGVHDEQQPGAPMHLLRVPGHTTKAAMSLSSPVLPQQQAQQAQKAQQESAAETGGAHFDTSEISNPVIAAALQRYERQRSRSNSSRRGGGSGSRHRPRSSGSSGGGRNSNSVLVEEEDADWLQERGRKGKDWLWRRTGSGGEAEYRNSSSVERSRTRSDTRQ
ncbi:Magnesium transporter ALR1 [Talaromyces islandicus]|uniref:Magnesium transporter ALR1 n=1 Tax=Talaromyces islandicus TaxID=28573 RepID=A0A0U1LKR9_TALIS|nr:Magnesium transporter ALR1 [Talaromyces islandicus]